ncbi:unnamed protein product [Protopolystoma xenopodis]|uniref:Uncharacterized protein n=1 Tax=Protopolystoma xenopodis TaxID=117903 RepID=A0A3S5FCF4_9PLAT|nr:unnamed protein product [Protopolystoma xenopodis]
MQELLTEVTYPWHNFKFDYWRWLCHTKHARHTRSSVSIQFLECPAKCPDGLLKFHLKILTVMASDLEISCPSPGSKSKFYLSISRSNTSLLLLRLL